MRLLTVLIATLVSIASATTPDDKTNTNTRTPGQPLILTIPPSANLPNPSRLPPMTHAIFSAPGVRISEPLTVRNTFEFHNVPAGSYLVDVYCATHGFAPMRVDIGKEGELLGAWDTFRGNDWDNKGEVVVGVAEGKLEVKVLGERDWFVERPKFSVMSLFKNPMILMAGVSLVMFMGMPWLMDNMDPELRSEFEAQQKKGGLLGALANGGDPKAAAPGANFDMAAYLSGSDKKKGGDSSGVQSGGVRR